MRAEPITPHQAWATARRSELALAGDTAMTFHAGSDVEALDRALELLRRQLGADACELFLTASDRGEMYMVSHQGADTEAFLQRDRFRVGEGFPGIVLSSAMPLRTEALSSEPAFVRSRVTSAGYTSVVCLPLRTGDAVTGSILLAWKSPPANLADVVRLAVLGSAPIAVAVELLRTRLRAEELARAARRSGERAEEGESTPGPAAGGGQWIVTPVEAHPETCPARQTQAVQVLGGRAGWPERCAEAGCGGRARYCVPLVTEGRVWGIATWTFPDRPPVPLTRFLPELLWKTEDLAAEPTTVAELALEVEGAPGARLRIRCFGGFEVRLEGEPLPRSAFRREKSRELLALLAAAGERGRPREDLARQLWPGVRSDALRNRFHVALSTLRRTVEAPGSERPHIVRDGRHYRLDPLSGVDVDLWRFGALLRRSSTPPVTDAVVRWLEAALALYRGDPFEGEFCASWPGKRADRARRQVLHAAALLARAKLERNEVPGALNVLRRIEEIAPREARLDPELERLRAACQAEGVTRF